MTTLAIDIGGTKLAAALVDTQHRVLEKQTLSTPASKTPAALTEALRELVAPFAGRPRQVAVASTGIIGHGVLTALNPDNLGGLAQFPLRDTLAQLTGLPCLAVNDAQAAAWPNITLWLSMRARWSSSPSLPAWAAVSSATVSSCPARRGWPDISAIRWLTRTARAAAAGVLAAWRLLHPEGDRRAGNRRSAGNDGQNHFCSCAERPFPCDIVSSPFGANHRPADCRHEGQL